MEQRESHLLRTELGRQVILFPFPWQGHLSPMLQLGSILHSRGFSIAVIHTNFGSPNYSNYPHFKFYSFDDGLSESEVSTSSRSILSFVNAMNTGFVDPFQECLAKVLSESSTSTVCIIVDPIWNFRKAVQAGITLPWIILQTCSVFSLLFYAAWAALTEMGWLPTEDSQAEEPLPYLPPLKVKDNPLRKLNARDTNARQQKLVDFFKNQIKLSKGFIYNSFQELEEGALTKLSQDFQLPMFVIGPFHKYFPASSSSLLPQDQTCISWLDNQAPKSVIYVSFGSLVTISELEFLEMAWGLANANLPFLWVVRPGLVRGAEGMETLPKSFQETTAGRGRVVKWAPQQQVLAHPAIGGFWTHSGWNSTLESICEGVPMICHPRIGDQQFNARHVSDAWNVGLHLEGRLERGEIQRAIRRLMVEAEGQAMRERSIHLKERVEQSFREGDVSYQALESLTKYIMSL